MSESTEIIRHIPSNEMGALSVADVRNQVNMIQQLMQSVMVKDEHYGVIPGCGTKPTLLQAGAQKISFMFKLSPTIAAEVVKDLPGGHREYETRVRMIHRQTGETWGEGVGTCSTMEAKYRFRGGSRLCPQCGKPCIIKGKQEYGGGFICFTKKGGCGAKFADNDTQITGQSEERVEYDNPADYFNTVRKMAYKRASNHATIVSTAASDFFTQDIEDAPELYGGHPAPPPATKATPAKPAAKPIPSTSGDDDKLTRISDVRENVKTGKTNGKAWSKHEVIDADGIAYALFTGDQEGHRLTMLNDAKESQADVMIHFENTKYGPSIRAVELAEETPI